MKRFGNIDFGEKYKTITGLEICSLKGSGEVGSMTLNHGVPMSIQGRVRDCVEGIIKHAGNNHWGSASWDPESGKCLWIENKNDADEEELEKRMNDFDIDMR